jgi:RNA polymerase sigma factor (sigma-70 family)
VATNPVSAASPAARLFEQYGTQLYRFCLARMRSREEAEDAVQSTFLRAHKALERGVVPEYEAAWLYKIAHNVCLTRRAALARQGQTVPLYDRDDIEVAVAAPEGRSDELWGLPDALAALSPNLRQAILLREWQGLSYAEIATAMETTVSAVETLIFRARRELAAALSAEKPKPRRRRLLDFLAALFGPKLAAGTALVLLGGAGVGTAFELQRQATTRPPAPQQAAVASAPIAAVIAVRPAATHARRQAAAAPSRHRTATPHRSATPPAAPPSSAAAPAPAAAPNATAAPAAPAAAPPAAPAAAAPPQAAQPAATATAAVNAVAPVVAAATDAVKTTADTVAALVPPVTVPSVQLPPVQVPTVQVSTVLTVSVPTVSIATPTVELGH